MDTVVFSKSADKDIVNIVKHVAAENPQAGVLPTVVSSGTERGFSLKDGCCSVTPQTPIPLTEYYTNLTSTLNCTADPLPLNAQRQIDRFIFDGSLLANFDSQGVEEYHCIHCLQRPILLANPCGIAAVS